MEKAILVGMELPNTTSKEVQNYLDELAELAFTAGAEVIATFTQKRQTPDGATFVGEGKLAEVHMEVHSSGANLVIFDAELSPTQYRNIEELLEVRVVDRTQLILDIFASRAHSKEGKLQVELAQLSYLLPRLAGKGAALSRLGGGIGTRGPGETKLEIDRRRIRHRINSIKRELAEVKVHRAQQRSLRKKKGLPLVSLVGYTNAGKSTLFNRLTEAAVAVEDKLFATLDPTVRRFELPSDMVVLASDTVGFIRKLPHALVEAFHSTLEEVWEADLLLHVVDASDPNTFAHIKAVQDVLTELGVSDKPTVVVLNKADIVDSPLVLGLQSYLPGSITISALTGQGMEDLLLAIEKRILAERISVKLLVPFDQGRLIDELHGAGHVLNEEYWPEGTYIEVIVEERMVHKLKQYQLHS